MDFSYVEEVSDLQSVVRVARGLRERYSDTVPRRKELMKQARDENDDDLTKLMQSLRPPAWFMVIECEDCPQHSLVSSKMSQATRFLCSACRKPASVAWVEEGSEEKVLAMYDNWADKPKKEQT
jgi:ribosomal protein S27E